MIPGQSAVYSRKRISPRTEPCGTPQDNVDEADFEEPQRIELCTAAEVGPEPAQTL